MKFDWVHYQFPPRIYFERDATANIGSLVKDIGSRVLLVTIQNEQTNPDELANIKSSIDRATTGCIIYDDFVKRPGFSELDTAAHFARQSRVDVVMAVGSRESFNAARAVALLCGNEVFASDLPHTQFPLKRDPLPIVTVPTVPTMGEETSPHFTVFNETEKSIFHAADWRLFPSIIFVDPQITTTLTESEMARAGVAVLAASIESILSKRANEITNSIALRALELIANNLVLLMHDSHNAGARTNVSMASLLAGMAHSNSQLGICYSIAAAVNYMTGLDFYTAMAILLPHVMEYNLTVSAGKYIHIARALDEDIKDITVIEAAIKAVEGVRKIYGDLSIPQRLSDFEIRKNDLMAIAALALQIPMIRNTSRDLDRNEVETILISAY